ncbi:ser/thr phosphatase family protein (macronuclear) [Tetrahymena thermophila SB210]|uniref:Ser/thr phosphatase family protein n=1 Tax=Tetrahymena thermophila (strain SB210) TaxID=312017 RepID=Q22G12_TETTS|nr:ser/thr phosphatase family protein [Tetrahymena thermophila SB210]EAR84214.2 ser/thr phosphatase family protein [Tetrahymena thermophila SB210]|eukprot:XP_001031877.2 ser/thr phosphatase family protein [Tetrahymena thermophila SB210]
MKKNNFVLTQVEKKNVFKDQENTFKILVATDNHVGYKENDPIRGNDSFEAFEEVLKIAKSEKVDFLLLGGDLFHETNPSQQCLYKMLNLLGNYVLGDGEILYGISNYNDVNFQDCNLNIELPIFVIHGNHDYPSDEYGNLSVIDLLHATKYLNHFGKFSNIEQIKVTPIIFQKGNTTVALYGIGYLKDKYFHKMLEEGKIEFVKPEQMGYKDTVNILVIHQNRYKGIRQGQSYRNCVHPEQFPEWIDFIIRGHEHEQKDDIDIMKECPIATIQPGSTILTAIEDVQATPRRAILFEIKGLEANFQDITLIQSYRPVLYEHVELTSVVKKAGFDLDNEVPADQAVEEVLWQFIQQSINNFKIVLKENFPNSPHLFAKKPILRFKIEQSNFDVFNFQRIESKLSDLVANPGEVLKFWKRIIINPKTIKNPKLEEDFIKTLKGKSDFDTIGNETVKDIKELYEDRIKKNKSISCLPSSLIMDTLEKVNLRNRNSSIEDIIKNLQNKLQENVAVQEEKEIRKVNEQYRQQMNSVLQKISTNIDERQKDKIDLDLKNSDKIIYKTLMNNQFDDLKQSLNEKIRTKVAELFIQDFQQDGDNDIDIENNSDGQYKESSTNKKSLNSDQMDSEEEDNKTSKVKGRGRKRTENKSITTKKQVKDFELEDNDYENENIHDEEDENQISQQKGFKGKFKNSKLAKEKANQNLKNRQEIKVEDSSDQDEEKIEKVNRRIKKSDNKRDFNAENEKPNMKSGFKQKMTYAQLFKKQNRMDQEEEEDYEENQQSDEDASQQSDCEFGLNGEKQKISYNIAHISEIQKKNQSNKSLPLLQVQQKKEQSSAIKIENSSNTRQSILSKKKPQAPQDEPRREQKELDIRELMMKRMNQANVKN